jgi:lipoprotein-anchoring transpeptidase ErfK/SrfK
MRAFAAFVLCLAAQTAVALDAQSINDAQWSKQTTDTKGGMSPVVVKAQILLDRAHFSPGEIDGKPGENFKKAVTAFSAEQAVEARGEFGEEVWNKLISLSEEPVLTDYTLLQDDVRGPFLETIPSKMEDMKDLASLGYTSPKEKLAEKFHMSQELLVALNPGKQFNASGERITVANVSAGALPQKAVRLEVDKTTQVLRAFTKEGKLIAVYPVTAGSEEKPAPSGTLKIVSVSKNPTYQYNPEYAFKGVRTKEPFKIKPGPNNPVGLAWIGLSAKSYGIHGTPDPSKVSKTESHGCIRMTNWDVLQLSSIVAKGTVVDFVGDEQARRNARSTKSTKRRH